MSREVMEFDVIIVGAGPAGLAAGIRLRQLAASRGHDVTVCIVEKGSEVGAHILSGAVIDPIALTEFLPDWPSQGAPLVTPVTDDRFLFLTETTSYAFPSWLLPPLMKNHGNYIVSLGQVCRWMAVQAEALGVEIFPGFAASEVLFHDDGSVKGVATGDMGVSRDGQRKASFAQGVELHAKYTLLAEGARGSLSKQVINRYNLAKGCDPQKFGIGIKELWEVDPAVHRTGLVEHSQGWPLGRNAGGGSFMYHLEGCQMSLGFVVHLDYENPYLSPFDEFQRFKAHPSIKRYLVGGRRVSYGARVINEGGLQSIPKLTFPGGALIGCAAGFVNLPRIKGTHNAMKTGMIAAEAAFEALLADLPSRDELAAYPAAFKRSWVHEDLYNVRNVKPGLKWGMLLGTVHGGLHMWLNSLGLGFLVPWTLHHQRADHQTLKPASDCKVIKYPKPDGVLTFDRLSSVFLSNTNHEEDQPVHLHLRDPGLWKPVNWDQFRSPESRYCPAAVYEAVGTEADRELRGTADPEATAGPGAVLKAGESGSRLVINAQNCVHCKTCDVKDPSQNIDWRTPEGTGGPNYSTM